MVMGDGGDGCLVGCVHSETLPMGEDGGGGRINPLSIQAARR